ncbi:tetratricopeptide repeat protein [Candidatus Thioglobus sp.]|nr:tetratricopeptide repeat protein [Candidatus Thioglobus sp.]
MKKHSSPATISLEPNKHELLDLLEHYQNRRYVDAEKLALLLTNKFKNHPFGWKVLGAIFNQTGRLSEGLIACQKSALLEPKNPEAHNNLGNTLQKLERLKEAEESYRKAIMLKQDYPEAHNNLGNILVEFGSLEDALASFKKAIEIKPNYAEAHYNQGNVHQEMGRIEEAEKYYRKAIELKSNYAAAYYSLGNMLKELGRLEESEGAYRHEISVNLTQVEEIDLETPSSSSLFKSPSPIEYANLYRKGMGTENVGGFLRAMAHMLRPSRILEVGAGYTTPFLLEALVNGERVFDDGNLQSSYFENYEYDPKLVVIDDMSLGELLQKPGMKDIISSKYVEFIHGKFEDKADMLLKKYGKFDFVWFDCGGVQEYQTFMKKYWDICSGYIFFHFTYTDGSPNVFHDIILDNITGSPFIFDIVEPHKKRQGSITMVKKNNYAHKQKTRAK